VPIYNFAIANEELASVDTDIYYPCCGKSICEGCLYSYRGFIGKCPFCNSDQDDGKTEEEHDAEIRKRVEANDPASIAILANYYDYGCNGLHQDPAKAIELYARAAELGFSRAHISLAGIYHEGGDLKKAKFHYEARLWQDKKRQE
jgi:TPR repeat protein